MKKFSFISFISLILSLVFATQVFAAASISVTSATITANNKIHVVLGNLGSDSIFTITAANWHIVTGSLSGSSAATTSSSAFDLTFAGTPFSAKDASYATGSGLYVDASGVVSTTTGATNVVSTSTQSIPVLDGQVPTLSAVTMTSNNSSSTLAKAGDIVTVRATSTENLATSSVVVLIDGVSATVTGSGTVWTATTTMTSGNTTGALSLSVSFTDLSGNAGTAVTSVTSGVPVTLDKTAPTFSGVTMNSNNSSTTIAIGTNIVTLHATSSETIQTPTITIFGRLATVTGSGTVWTATSTVSTSTDPSGAVAFSISASDLAGNTVTQTTLTSGAGVFFYGLPTVTLNGVTPDSISVGHTFTDLGAVALDSRGTVLTVSTVSTVNKSVLGSYTVKYGAVDSLGNQATSTRVVNVLNGTARPVVVTKTGSGTGTVITITPVATSSNTGNHVSTNPVITISYSTSSPSSSAPVTISMSPTSGISIVINRQLKFGGKGTDIQLLQKLLSSDSSIYPSGLVTGYFGSLTQQAVQKFQEKYGIAKKGMAGYGEVGPKTKVKLMELFGR